MDLSIPWKMPATYIKFHKSSHHAVRLKQPALHHQNGLPQKKSNGSTLIHNFTTLMNFSHNLLQIFGYRR